MRYYLNIIFTLIQLLFVYSEDSNVSSFDRKLLKTTNQSKFLTKLGPVRFEVNEMLKNTLQKTALKCFIHRTKFETNNFTILSDV
jgi:hypothetical protein